MWHSRLAWTVLLTLLLCWALGDWVGERTLPTLLLAYLPLVCWTVPAFCALLWTLWRRRGVPVALLAVVLSLWQAELLPRPVTAVGPQADSLRLVTFNVLSGRHTDALTLAHFLASTNADLILLQESAFTPQFRRKLSAALPGYRLDFASEVTTLSRLPVQEVKPWALPGIKRQVLVSTVLWQGHPLTVVNAHLGTVQVSDLLFGQFDHLRRVAQRREQQVQLLEHLAHQSSGPIILAGDLNTPPRGQHYRRLQRAYGPDAHASAGRGSGWTFPALYTRIDHVMARDLLPIRAEVLPTLGSDHRPVQVEYGRVW